MNFEMKYMAKLQRQNRMILALDISKQKADPCCLRLRRGCINKGGVVLRDWITLLIFTVFLGSFVFLMVACGL